ncbi:hypothetical protein [Janthinobacterium sp.]|uniref:hypothetical protein n=1 Tax=Janthinobacterium sp. TaxID=1871054 RepID=UPI00293D5D94|nr:hypothetical protein [Janthinobacterium sp.]
MAAKMVKAIVAPRRTVRSEGKDHGPGAEVTLSAEDAEHLRAIGFIVNPAAPAEPPVADGPTFELAGAA